MLSSKLSYLINSSSRRITESASSAGSTLLKNPLLLFILAATGLHIAFWLLLPNPIKKSEKPKVTEVVSTVPVVNLPRKPAANTSKSSPLNLSNLANLPNSPSVLALDPLTVPPLDLSSFPTDTTPLTTTAPPISFSPSFLEQNLARPYRSRINTDKQETNNQSTTLDNTNKLPKISNLKPELRGNTLQIPTKPENNILDVPSKTTKNQDPLVNNNQDTNNSNLLNPVNPAVKVPEVSLSDEITNNIFREYQGKIFLTRIVPPTAVVSSSQKEPGVKWIAPTKPNGIKSKEGIVEVALLVNPEGKVEQVLIKRSGIAELDKLASQTVEGYFDKFKPIDNEYLKAIDVKDKESLRGKYRYITIRYDFSNLSFAS